PGISSVYLGGVCTYTNEMKVKVLGVRQETLERYGAVSEEVAGEMASGIASVSGSDLALSITGIAGPGGGRP
ncbi:MAG TPA: competence/damage-inducible protein A, partial [Clostridiales bacterium]|nr:competence/damage-inducible protein A [Clostridiales bacterium]